MASHREPSAWQTPGYTVIETALEVTAYSLNAR
ncbi:pyrroloquinoline quinone precursor peptide PqqA [Streptomyces inhibens]